MRLYSDKKSTISIAHNPEQHERTKYVKIDQHFVKKKLETDVIGIPYILSEDRIVDVLTKRLPTQ